LVKEFDKALKEARDAVSDALLAPEGADLSTIMATAQRSINRMLNAVESISTKSEQEANTELERIKDRITRIFAPLELLEEKKGGKSQERISRSEVNIQQETQAISA
jgi:hypothetical protein